MKHPLRALALGLALAATPACAAFQAGETHFENPIAAARTIDQRAYTKLHASAAIVEEAGDIVRDPAAPIALKRALGQAELAATPAVEVLQIAVVAYVRAQSDFGAATHDGQPAIERAAAALAAAARRLNEAVTAAQAPMSQLEALVRSR